MKKWPVVPICDAQIQDVRYEDLLEGGLYRKCDTYRGGGGYDQFARIASQRMDIPADMIRTQFVAQLRGCPLRCHYCYVTPAGYLGVAKQVTTAELVGAFERSKLQTFHLMGGAPALHLSDWPELQDALPPGAVFHSDMLLVEGNYSGADLTRIAHRRNHIIAVDIKGVTPDDHLNNTGRPLNEEMFWRNFDALNVSNIEYYITFTNPDPNHLDEFKDRVGQRYGPHVLRDSFVIDLVDYEAIGENRRLLLDPDGQ